MKPEHPDANLLTAFVEKKLPGQERGDVMAHLAECAECRKVVALAAAAPVAERRITPAWRWAAAAASVALLLTGAWGLRVMLSSPAATSAPAVAQAEKLPPPASLPSADIAVQPQLAPAPKVAARPALRKPAKRAPLPKERELPPQFVAPQAAMARSAGAAGFMTAKIGSPRLGALWRIRNGMVEQSLDGGSAWHPLFLGGEFHAIASEGADVWAGGAHGALFHSRDAGLGWTQVTVGGGGEGLNGTIVTIRLPYASEVVLETDSGQQWISHDNGVSWNHL